MRNYFRLAVSFVFALNSCIPAQAQMKTDPFQSYLTGRPPVITEDLGTATDSDGVRIQKLVFRSRMVNGQPSLVFAAIAHPAGAGKFPAILRLHGGGGAADIPAAISSARAGYVCLVLDIPGVTGDKTKNPRTTGSWETAPKIGANPDITHSALFDAVISSIEAFYLLRAQPDTDTARMGVAGASWGGYTATMLAGLLNKDLAATWSVFGSGNFLEGAFEKTHIEQLPEAERIAWLTYLDPGKRAGNITKPFFIATASNDRHWSWMAVQATLASMKGPVNQMYSPNTNHQIQYPGGSEMIPFFNQYLKGGLPMPVVKVIKSRREKDGRLLVQYQVDNAARPVAAKVYYTFPGEQPVWTERKWLAAAAVATGKKYTAIIPASAQKSVDLFAIITDIDPELGQDSTSVSSLIKHVK